MVPYHQVASRGTDTRFGARTSANELTHWCCDICTSVIGLFTLFFFLVMGGIFALVGPWVILVGILSVRKGPGWQVWSYITGAGLLSLSVMALLLPSHAGGWGAIGGMLGLLGELGYIALPLLRHVRQR